MRLTAQILSVLFHPLLLLTYMLWLLMRVNPYIFGSLDLNRQGILLLVIFIHTFVMPLAAVLLMIALGFIDTYQMRTMNERVGPYIAVGTFYIWTYLNMANYAGIPPVFRVYVLGATLAVFLSFFINIFSKISMHTVGMGGLVAMTFFTYLYYSYYDISYIFLGIIALAGAVGTARLSLDAHKATDVLGGYLVGFVCQFVAHRVLLGV